MNLLQEVYCINMKKSVDRKIHMDDFFKKLNLSVPVYRFDGINGARVINPRPKKHVLGHVGCLLSHMSMWHLISQKSAGFYLIVEDDLAMVADDDPSGFEHALNETLNSLPDKVQMLHCTLDKSKKFKYKKSRFEEHYKTVGSFNERPIKKCSLVYPWASLTGAYLLTQRLHE